MSVPIVLMVRECYPDGMGWYREPTPDDLRNDPGVQALIREAARTAYFNGYDQGMEDVAPLLVGTSRDRGPERLVEYMDENHPADPGRDGGGS